MRHIVLTLIVSVPGQMDAITQVGTGVAGDRAHGQTAQKAVLREPFDAAFDKHGNLYFSDTGNHKIRKVDARTGVVTTLAGTGESGLSGDGGPAIEARLNEPYGVAVDGQGNVYFADRLNRRVRVVDAKSGNIRTVAGDGSTRTTGDGGPATAAGLAEPNGVAHDGQKTLYVADVAGHRIRAVNLLDGTITTLAGDGQAEHDGDGGPATRASIHGARAVEVDSKGNVYIVEREGNSLRTVDPRTGLITTIAGKGSLGYGGDGGPAAEALFRGPKELAVSPEGHIYVVDTENHAIRKIDAHTRSVSTVAGTGKAGARLDGPRIELDRPHGVAIAPDGAVWVVDTGNHRLVRVHQ